MSGSYKKIKKVSNKREGAVLSLRASSAKSLPLPFPLSSNREPGIIQFSSPHEGRGEEWAYRPNSARNNVSFFVRAFFLVRRTGRQL